MSHVFQVPIFDKEHKSKSSVNLNKLSQKILNEETFDSKPEKKSQTHKTSMKKKIVSILESITSQIIIMIVSTFSILNQDFRLLLFPISADHYFEICNTIVFFLFLTEFILLCLLKKSFIGTFAFWVDIVAITSLLPEVEFIWLNIEHVLFLNKNTNQIEINSNPGSPGSSLSNKIGLYLKFIKLVNFLKIIRIAKIITASRIIVNKRRKSMNESKITKNNIKTFSRKKFRDLSRKDLNEAVRLVLHSPRNSKKNSAPNLKFAHKISFPQQTQMVHKRIMLNFMSPIRNKADNTNINKANYLLLNKFPSQTNENHEESKRSLTFFRKNFFLNANDSDGEKVYSYLIDEENPESFSFSVADFSSRILKNHSIIYPLKIDANLKPQNDEKEHLSNAISQLDENQVSQEILKDESKNYSSDSDSETNDKPIGTNQFQSFRKNSKLEKNLIEFYTQKNIIILMSIIILMPLLQSNFILDLNNMAITQNPSRFCLLALSHYYKNSIVNANYLKGFEIIKNKCYQNISFNINSTDINNSSNVNIYPNNITILQLYLKNHRTSIDYNNYTCSSPDCVTQLSLLTSNYELNNISYILNIIKAIITGTVLLLITYYMNQDIISIVIIPMSRIINYINFHISYLEDYNTEEEIKSKIKILMNSDVINENSFNNPKETTFIEVRIKNLIELISTTIGKHFLYMIPFTNINLVSFQLNKNSHRIKYSGSILMMNIKNFKILFQNKSICPFMFLNQIYDLFHKIGVSFCADIIDSGSTLMWKWDENEYIKQLEIYSRSICQQNTMNSDNPTTIKNNNTEKEKNEHWDENSNKAVLCGIKFLSSLVKSGFYSKIIEFKIEIDLFIDEGVFFSNYSDCNNKLFNVVFSKAVTNLRKIIEFTPSFNGIPGIHITEESYQNLSNTLKQTIYPFPLIDKNGEIKFVVYRQFLNIIQLKNKKMVNLQSIQIDRNEALKNRKYYSKIFKSSNSPSDLIMSELDIKSCLEDFDINIKILMSFAVKKLMKEDFTNSLKSLKDMEKISVTSGDEALNFLVKKLKNDVLKLKKINN